MLILDFLITTIINIYVILLILKIWMQYTYCIIYEPFLRFINKLTSSNIEYMIHIFPYIKSKNLSSLLIAFVLMIIKFFLLNSIKYHIFSFILICFLIGLLSLLKTFGILLFWIIIIRLLCNLFNRNYFLTNTILFQLSETFLYPLRNIIPYTGNIDFSIIIIIIILYLLNYILINLFPNIWFLL